MFRPPPGVEVVDVAFRDTYIRYAFVITCTNLADMAKAIVDKVDSDCRVIINDHRRGDDEGGVIFMANGKTLLRMSGGHGYSSEWSEVTKDAAADEAIEALTATRFGHPGGSFEIRWVPGDFFKPHPIRALESHDQN